MWRIFSRFVIFPFMTLVRSCSLFGMWIGTNFSLKSSPFIFRFWNLMIKNNLWFTLLRVFERAIEALKSCMYVFYLEKKSTMCFINVKVKQALIKCKDFFAGFSSLIYRFINIEYLEHLMHTNWRILHNVAKCVQ